MTKRWAGSRMLSMVVLSTASPGAFRTVDRDRRCCAFEPVGRILFFLVR